MAPRCVGGLLVVLLGGGLGLARAGEAPENDKARPGRLLIRAVAAANGSGARRGRRPVPGAARRQVRARNAHDRRGRDGAVRVETGGEDRIARLDGAEGRVRPGLYLLDQSHSSGDRCRRKRSCGWSRGRRSGGWSRTRTASRSAGPRSKSRRRRPSRRCVTFTSRLGETHTDDAGRWRLADAPASFGNVSVRVTHPDFYRGGGRACATPRA